MNACANVHCANACVCFEANKYSSSSSQRSRLLSIDIIILPAGRSEANPSDAAAAVDSWDRQTDGQTDGRTLDRFIDPAARIRRPCT